mgnify:FL=1
MEQIDLASHQDITDFSDEEQVSVNKVNHQFQQESRLKGIVREFTIFNDVQCYQRVIRKHGGKHKFRINLTYLDVKSERDFILADSWLITAAISAVFSFLIVYAGWFSQLKFSQSMLTLMAITSVSFCCIAFLIALLRTNDRIVFFSRHGHAPILEFINKNPDSQTFQEFKDTLQKQILQARKNSGLSATDQLKLELKELRRLKDETVISEALYEKAKKRILKNRAFTS